MNTIVALVTAVPQAVWLALLASVSALAGVLVANSSNTKRLRIQLEHDAREKARDRMATLRREVYLNAVQEFARVNAYLASIPQLDPVKVNMAEGLQGLFGAAAKVQLVGEPATTLLAMRLVGHYGELLLKLLARARPMHDAKIEITANQDLQRKADGEVERVMAELKKQMESGRPDASIVAPLRQSLEFHQHQSNLFAKKQAAAWGVFTEKHRQFLRALLEDMRALADQQIAVQIAIRQDLGLVSDLAAVQQEMETQRLKVVDGLERVLQSLEEPRLPGA